MRVRVRVRVRERERRGGTWNKPPVQFIDEDELADDGGIRGNTNHRTQSARKLDIIFQ